MNTYYKVGQMKSNLYFAQVYTNRGFDDEYVRSYRPRSGEQTGFQDGVGKLLFSFGTFIIVIIGLATIVGKGPQLTKWMGAQAKKGASAIWKKSWKFVVGAIICYFLFIRR